MSSKKKQKQVSIEEYIETYCREKRIRRRFAVYVSPETHRKLRSVAGLFGSEHYTTTSSLADSILSSHFDTHRELLNDAHREDVREFMEKWSEDTRNYRKTEQADEDNPQGKESESNLGQEDDI